MAGFLALGLVVALAAFAAYVRLAPSNLARWHVDPVTLWPAGEARVMSTLGAKRSIVTTVNSATAWIEVEGPQTAALARLDEIALATPRTTRLAGSPEEGRITWVTRSALWGFPDYTTASAITHDVATSEMSVVARLRYGESDLGVNAARLRDWLSRL